MKIKRIIDNKELEIEINIEEMKEIYKKVLKEETNKKIEEYQEETIKMLTEDYSFEFAQYVKSNKISFLSDLVNIIVNNPDTIKNKGLQYSYELIGLDKIKAVYEEYEKYNSEASNFQDLETFKGINKLYNELNHCDEEPLKRILIHLIAKRHNNQFYMNEEKNVKDMVQFIREKITAKYQSENRRTALIEHKEVFDLAELYFMKSNKELDFKTNNATINKMENKNKSTNTKKNKKEIVEKQEEKEKPLTLFDMGGF